jgi:adenine-specific DNA-methyltransferase
VDIDLDELSKDELIEMLRANSSRLKFGLVWENNPEEIVEFSRKNLPYLVKDEKKSFTFKNHREHNLLIEGDNYQSLLALTATHAGKIDCIYIDPPYNTGARDWIYNNDYVDDNDTYRHSKWLSMMKHRLQIAKVLLKDDGVFICAIDENELPRLWLLLEQIFVSHELHCISIVHNPRGTQGSNFSNTHEYAIFVIPKNTKSISKQPKDEISFRNFRRDGVESERNYAKNCFYPIIVRGESIIGFGEVSQLEEHPKKNEQVGNDIYVYPIDNRGIERKWGYARNTVEPKLSQLRAKIAKSGQIEIEMGRESGVYKTHWIDSRYDANQWGTKMLQALVPENDFDFPKSIWTTYDCVAAAVRDRKDAIVLDFFAGSGTTGHALQVLNNEDRGRRTFILCTNNENNIAKNVTQKRLKASTNKIAGFEEITDLSFNLEYFRVETQPKSSNHDEKILDFLEKAIGYIQIIEGTFTSVMKNDCFEILKAEEKFLGVYASLDPSRMKEFRDILFQQNGDRVAYIATLDQQGLQEFDLYGWDGVNIKTFPAEFIQSMEANSDN